MKAFVPEIQVYNLIGDILSYIREDLIKPTYESILYEVFKEVTIGSYNYYKQAKHLFGKGVNKSDRISHSLFFQPTKATFPHIHIMLPGEDPGDAQGLGVDAGYIEPTDEGGEVFTRSYRANFSLVITGRSSEEVLLIYAMLKHILIAIYDELDIMGFRNPSLGGADMQLKMEGAPMAFYRALTLSFFYETSIASIQAGQIINQIKFFGKAVIQNDN